MTNQEFKEKNNELLAQITSKELVISELIKSLISNIKVPIISTAFASKINELMNLFDEKGYRLEEQLTFILTSQYLFSRYMTYIKCINTYVIEITNALRTGNNNLLRELLSKKEQEETLWEKFNNELLNYDFQNDLETLFNSGIKIPENKSKEEAYNICMKELSSINYVPKRRIETNEQQTSKYVM